jgi:hypothetical protein
MSQLLYLIERRLHVVFSATKRYNKRMNDSKASIPEKEIPGCAKLDAY